MEAPTVSEPPAYFYDHLRCALELFDRPALLGAQSPLATPYVLGEALRGFEASDSGRGMALRALILRAAEQLWGGPLPADGASMLAAALADGDSGYRYDCLVLELNYFKERYRPAPRNQAEIYVDILHISRPTHDRHLRCAVECLGAALLALLRPALYLEQPAPPLALVGRADPLARLQAGLAAGKRVALVGRGVVGKTALGAAAAAAWGPAPRFWYTFRLGLSDQLAGLLFTLGRFLHGQGASALWHQLVADRGRMPDGALALGLALADLRQLPAPPLLCFDDLDVLRPADAGQPHPAHAQILAFLEGLGGHVPLLLIGQQLFWAHDALVEVGELSHADLATWLTASGLPHAPADVSHLYDYTAGNPRLAELCVALFQTGASPTFAAALEQLPQTQALLPLWLRLERDLSALERRVLQTLAVFRRSAPADAWLHGAAEEAAALDRLVARRLARLDGRGGVALPPPLRAIIYRELPAERREELHARAAQIRAERGAYTAAAYHLHRAGLPEAAIELWHAYGDQEIEQGQAAAALAIFAQIAPRRLSARHAELLLLLRARLHELAGEPASVVDDLVQASWDDHNPATPEAMLRLGRAVQAQGDRALALRTFQVGLDAAALLRVSTQLYAQRSLAHVAQRDMGQAWREARLAYFHAVVTMGVVSAQSGEHAAARGHYLTALAAAEELGYQAGMAEAHHHLAALAGRHQALDEALHHFERALAFYERIGDRRGLEHVRGNMACAFVQARRFAEALAPAEQALRFFTALGDPFRAAQHAANLALAHAELGSLDQAEALAHSVLRQDEPQSHPAALYALGVVQLRRGDLAQAERYYDQSRRLALINDDRYQLGFAWRALGEVARAQGSEERAGPAFAEAIGLFHTLQLDEEVRRTEDLAAAVALPQGLSLRRGPRAPTSSRPR